MQRKLSVRTSPKSRVLAMAAAVGLAAAASGRAETRTWTSTDVGDGNWSLAEAWNGDTTINPGDSLVFAIPVAGGTRTTTNDLVPGTYFGGIAITANAFALGGNDIALGGTLSNTGGTSSVSLNLTGVGGGGGIDIGGGSRIDFSGDLAGAVDIVKTGSGNLRLQGVAKTFSGDFVIDAGTVETNAAISLLPAGFGKGSLVVNSGAVLSFLNSGSVAVNGLRDGDAGGGTIQSGASGTKTFTVGNGDGSGSFSGVIQNNASTLNFTKVGLGSQTLAGGNLYTGTTSANGGTLVLDFGGAQSADIVAAGSALRFGGGTLLVRGGSAEANTQSFSGLGVNSGAGKLELTPGGDGGTVSVTVTTAPFRTTQANNANVGGTLQIGTAGSVVFSASLNQTLLRDAQNNPYATYGLKDWAATNATGMVIAATYVDVSGAIASNSANINNVTGNATTSSTDMAAIRFANSTAAVTVTNSNTSTLRGILMTDDSLGATISGGFIRPNRVLVSGSTFSIIQNSTLGDLLITSSISNASSGTPVAVAKSGAGRLILGIAGDNGYTGQTFVNEGVLSISHNGQLGGQTTGAQLNLLGGAVEATETFALENTGGANKRAISLVNAGGIYVAAGKTFTVNGVISGSGMLIVNPANGTYTVGATTVTDTGTLALTGSNTFSGGTIIRAGTLAVSGTGTLGSGGVTVGADGTLVLEVATAVGDAAELIVADGGMITVTGGVETVGSLLLGDMLYTTGTIGGLGSGADVIREDYFNPAGSGNFVAVPEPGSIGVLAAAALALGRRRRRR